MNKYTREEFGRLLISKATPIADGWTITPAALAEILSDKRLTEIQLNQVHACIWRGIEMELACKDAKPGDKVTDQYGATWIARGKEVVWSR